MPGLSPCCRGLEEMWQHTKGDHWHYFPPKVLFINHESREEASGRFLRFSIPTSCRRLSSANPRYQPCPPIEKTMFIDPRLRSAIHRLLGGLSWHGSWVRTIRTGHTTAFQSLRLPTSPSLLPACSQLQQWIDSVVRSNSLGS
jgi:hypothetical protein